MKDLIKYKGFQVAPSEIESILIQHPLVREAAVIGVFSADEATEVPRGFVSLKDVIKSEQRAWVSNSTDKFLAERIFNYKRLRGGVFIVDELPRNPTGKVLKKVLKEKYGDLSSPETSKLTAKL